MRAETGLCSLLCSCFWLSGSDNCQVLACMLSIDRSRALTSGNYQVLIGLNQSFSGTITPNEVAFVNLITTWTASSIFHIFHGYSEYNVQPEKIAGHLLYAQKPLASLTEPKVTFTQILFKNVIVSPAFHSLLSQYLPWEEVCPTSGYRTILYSLLVHQFMS